MGEGRASRYFRPRIVILMGVADMDIGDDSGAEAASFSIRFNVRCGT